MSKKNFENYVEKLLNESTVNGKPLTKEEQEKWKWLIEEQTKKCIISKCSAPSAGAGMFIPDSSEEFAAPPGKERRFFYGLCEAHAAELSPDEIENRLYDLVAST